MIVYLLRFIFSVRKVVFPMTAIAVLATACEIINPAEPIPSYIHVDSFSVYSDSLSQGSSSSNIVDVWAYLDGNVIGTFELPATFPVLSTGSHKLTLRPGILIDGIAATRTIYPFYSGYDTTVNLESEKIATLSPKVTYLSSANLDHREDFDHVGSNIVATPASDTTITPVLNQNSLEGYSGAVYLDNDHDYFECAWKDSFPLPTGVPSYIELDYKNDIEFTVGIITYTPSGTSAIDVATFRSSATWKKQYVGLISAIGNSVTATGFKMYIRATKSSSVANASLYFDNIKVVY